MSIWTLASLPLVEELRLRRQLRYSPHKRTHTAEEQEEQEEEAAPHAGCPEFGVKTPKPANFTPDQSSDLPSLRF